MVIRSERSRTVILLLALIIGGIYCYYIGGLIDILALLLCGIYIVLDLFITGRTIIMDSTGVTIKLFQYEKKYTWKELNTNVRKDYYGAVSDVILFSEKSIIIPSKRKINTLYFCMFRHPTKCFFVRPCKKRLYTIYKDTQDYDYLKNTEQEVIL